MIFRSGYDDPNKRGAEIDAFICSGSSLSSEFYFTECAVAGLLRKEEADKRQIEEYKQPAQTILVALRRGRK